METPKPISVKDESNPDCPIGVITVVVFDHKEFDDWATENPTSSFEVMSEDGFPCLISAVNYVNDRSSKWPDWRKTLPFSTWFIPHKKK